VRLIDGKQREWDMEASLSSESRNAQLDGGSQRGASGV
jgi:hypothetical protein